MNKANIVAMVIAMVIAATVGMIVVTEADGGDEFCEHALGPGAEYLDGQPAWDSQLDCVAPNGTVVRDVDVPPMNLTSNAPQI